MTRLRASEVRNVNRVLLALYEGVDPRDPLESFLDLIEQILPVTWLSVDEADRATGRIAHRGGRRLEPIPDLAAKIARYCRENPVVKYVLNGNFSPALLVSDFISFRQITNTAFFQEIVGCLPGWRDQSAIALRLPGSVMGFGLNRDRAFTGEERLMLEIVQPHFERVMTRLTQYAQLPAVKALTAREREVLHWLAEGKRDMEIATILGRSQRTIEQHVGACLRKLGVENRASAIAAVWRSRTRGSAERSEKEELTLFRKIL